MLEAIGIGVVSNAVFDELKYGLPKAREVLTREEYEQEVDAITAAITTALKESVVPALVSDTGMTEAQLDEEWDWAAIAAELDALEVWSQDRQTAIVHLTEAIEAGLNLAFDVDSPQRTTLEVAVTTGYRNAVRQFIEEIAGTPLADELELLTDRELLAVADTIEERLTALEQELRGKRAALRDAGFVRLDSLYFERHTPGDPEAAWRTGFNLAEVRAGYPLARERPATTTDERQVIAEQVYERLSDGEHLVVKGEGGTGKSTVCKRVACRWDDAPARGPVLYRGSATITAFDTPGTLIDAIRATEEDLLVVVEDAPSGGASAIFEVLADCEGASDVSFLLDARDGAWEAMTEVGGHASLERQRQQLGIVDMPALDERECHRAIEHYETLTGEEVGRSGEQLYEEVRGADLGGPLVVAYQLTGPAIDTERPVSALHADVRRAYTAVEERAADEEFPQTVATMINILNAAGLPVEAAFVHAVADEPAAHRQIERTLGFLEGTMLEQSEGDFRLPHQLWSALYLQHMLDMAGERLARDRFERCVGALFRLFDDEDARTTVRRWVRSPPASFTAITDVPEETAGRFVRHFADIGTIRPRLGQLYGTPETWRVPLPDPCPPAAHFQWWLTRGRIHIGRGAFEAAQAEFEHADRVIDIREDGSADPARQRATVGNALGSVAFKRGELSTANEYHEESLALFRELGDRHGEATSLGNLGLVAFDRGELSTAQEYYEESLALFRELGDRHGEATSLGNLGNLAFKRRELSAAQEYLEESLALRRELGDRHGEATSLGNHGNVALKRGELSATQEYYEESLALYREVGDRHQEARSLNNLGNLAFKRRELSAAQEYYEESLTLRRKIGDRHSQAASLNNLGNVARKRGELSAAQEYLEESLALYREVGDWHSQTISLTTLGNVTKRRGELEAAQEYLEESLSSTREVGDRHQEATSLHNLGLVAFKRGELSTAQEYHTEALSLAREVGDPHKEAKILRNLGKVAQACENLAVAEEHVEAAVVLLHENELTGDAFDGFAELIDVCEQRGAESRAIEWCEKAIEFADRTEQATERERFQARRSELVATDECRSRVIKDECGRGHTS